ncbi:hypothetical protein SDC9_172030 [bioreactor metagenome]|uniref:Uncharacterized protein n=1 Tax=bioreactor metagenome TaxID=1076179 RepID=A0A645GFS2_9ZZZZ
MFFLFYDFLNSCYGALILCEEYFIDGGDFFSPDLASCCLLYLLQYIIFPGSHQSICGSFPVGPAGPAYPVDIGFRILRQIIIYYMRYILYVNPSCCYICCHQKIQIAFLELSQSAHPLALAHISMHSLSIIPPYVQCFHQLIYAFFGFAKYNSA